MNKETPHRRYNPLTGEWILVSPHRTKRPWQGKTEHLPIDDRPKHDPNCYLCPGNGRASGDVNPKYEGTYVFTNDFAALLENVMPQKKHAANGLIKAETVEGICKVLCFDPDHSLTLPLMSQEKIEAVVQT